MPLSTGQLLQHDRYRIVSLLGQGGMGAVYRAWDTSLNIPVAIKENLDASPEAQRQFSNEAGMLARLAHPNLPRVSDYFFVPGQGQYLVMDFIQGEDLQAKLNAASQARPQPAGLPEAQALSWIIQVCDALDYLHGQPSPVIHRDIKPANIKIRPDGRAVLVDFGIAKLYDPSMATTMGARAVTPGYSPPEQYGGGRTDPRSDIYALGATLYHLLTGVQPPESVSRMAGAAALPEPRQVNPAISPATSHAIQRATELVREQRFQSISELKRSLSAPPPPSAVTAFAPTPAVQAAPAVYTPAAPAKQVVVQRKIPAWLIAGGAVLAVAIFAMLAYVLVVGIQPQATPPPTAQAPTLAAVAPTLAPADTPIVPTEILATEAPIEIPLTEPPTALPARDAVSYIPVSKIVLPAGANQTVRWVDVTPPYVYVLSREGGLYTYDLAMFFKLEEALEQYDQPVSQSQMDFEPLGMFRHAGNLYAYWNWLQTIDLTNPGMPSLMDKISWPWANSYAIQANLLAVGLQTGFAITDLYDPDAQPWLSQLDLGSVVFGIALRENFLYTSEFKMEPYGDYTLRAFDIVDPRTPREMVNIKTEEVAYHLKFYSDQMVACLDTKVELWSLADPASPVLTASQPAAARACALDGANIVTAGEVIRIEGNDLVKIATFDGAGSNASGFPYGSAVTDNYVFLAFDEYLLILQKEY
jgi:hypothetical protein